MKNKEEIIKILDDIEKISTFQKERITNKKAVNQELVLEQALNFIEIDILKIREQIQDKKPNQKVLCDTCGEWVEEKEYNVNAGLCNKCVEKIQ